MEGYKLFVGNLHFKTTDEDLRKCFPEASVIHRVVDRQTDKFYGTAFVWFSQKGDRDQALNKKFTILDRELRMQ